MDFLSSFSSSLSVLLDRMKTCLSNRFAIRRNALFDESSIGFSSVITYAGILVNWRCRFMEYLQFLLFRWKFNSIDESWTFWWYRFIKNFIPSVIIDTVRSKDREKRIQNYISSNDIRWKRFASYLFSPRGRFFRSSAGDKTKFKGRALVDGDWYARRAANKCWRRVAVPPRRCPLPEGTVNHKVAPFHLLSRTTFAPPSPNARERQQSGTMMLPDGTLLPVKPLIDTRCAYTLSCNHIRVQDEYTRELPLVSISSRFPIFFLLFSHPRRMWRRRGWQFGARKKKEREGRSGRSVFLVKSCGHVACPTFVNKITARFHRAIYSIITAYLTRYLRGRDRAMRLQPVAVIERRIKYRATTELENDRHACARNLETKERSDRTLFLWNDTSSRRKKGGSFLWWHHGGFVTSA